MMDSKQALQVGEEAAFLKGAWQVRGGVMSRAVRREAFFLRPGT